MILKSFISLFFLVQNEEIVKGQVSEFLQAKKVDNLSQLVTLLTIALLLVLAILTFTLIQKHKLEKENLKLNSQIND